MAFIAFLLQSLAGNLSTRRETEYEYLTRMHKESDNESNHSR